MQLITCFICAICRAITKLENHVVLHTGNYISLCSGVGGLDLSVKIALPGARCVCYVERESFAAAVLVARMEDSPLDKAPVWSDVATFDCTPWRGCVDFVVAGFPCQPVSKAGRKKGEQDERWIWEDVIRVVRELGARWVFLENVPGILFLGLGTVLGGLHQIGMSAEWACVPASRLGAPHKRDRWFCLGYTDEQRLEGWGKYNGTREGTAGEAGNSIFPPGPSSHVWKSGELPPVLSPSFVEGLMALQVGWTAFEPLEDHAYHYRVQSLYNTLSGG